MKRLFSLLVAALMLAAICVPAFAANEEPVFDTKMQLVANDPTVEYDEWDIPYNVWSPISDNTAIHAGDIVTMMLSYTVPETVEGYDERLTASIEMLTTIEGVDDLQLVEAQGCPGRIECDYEIGICYPIPGEYANVDLDGNELKVMAELGSDVKVIVRGTAAGDTVSGNTAVTIGQYRFPAVFSLGTVDKAEANGFPSYNVHWSDFMLVQKRAVEFRTDETGVMYTMYPAMNNHYYRFIPGDHEIADFVPVDADFMDTGDPIDHDDPMFATLSDIITQVVEFFGLCYNQIAFTDYDFIGDGEHYTFNYPFEFGGDEPAPTEAPAEPTEAPAEPEPTEAPSDPDVPSTGAISLAIAGVIAAAGAGAAVIGKRKSR